MSTELTVTTARAIELPESIAYAYASKEEIVGFVKEHLDEISDSQLRCAGYAYARALYRDGEMLSVRQLSILAETTVEKIQHFVRRLFKTEPAAETKLSNNQCSSILSVMMEM